MLVASRNLLLALSVSWWCVACAGKSNGGEEEPRGGAGGSASTGGVGSGGKPSAGAGGMAQNPECAALRDDDPYYIAVSIRNDTKETLFLGTETMPCVVVPWFEVSDAEDRPLVPVGNCRGSCESAMSDNPLGGCPAICAAAQAVELRPGEVLSTAWTGQYLELVGLPKACQSDEYPAAQCDRARSIEPGSFTFSATAGTELDCSPTGNDCPPCVRSSEGGCVTSGALIGGSVRTARTQLELDAGYGVGAGNGDGNDGALNIVEITFEEP
jgi:hypothetical protein